MIFSDFPSAVNKRADGPTTLGKLIETNFTPSSELIKYRRPTTPLHTVCRLSAIPHPRTHMESSVPPDARGGTKLYEFLLLSVTCCRSPKTWTRANAHRKENRPTIFLLVLAPLFPCRERAAAAPAAVLGCLMNIICYCHFSRGRPTHAGETRLNKIIYTFSVHGEWGGGGKRLLPCTGDMMMNSVTKLMFLQFNY